MKAAVTALVTFDAYHIRKDGSLPARLRITYQRKRKYYAIGRSCSPEMIERVQSTNPRTDALKLKSYFQEVESKARQIIEELPTFSFDEFEARFLSKPTNRNGVFDRYEAAIADKRAEQAIGTASGYEQALKSLKEYTKGKPLQFAEVTVKFLNAYEDWMLKPRPRTNGSKTTITACKPNTVSKYLRTLRTIYNLAIAERLVSRDAYPFGPHGYKLPSNETPKKALDNTELEKLLSYKPADSSPESFYLDMFRFSYLCNGMNMHDIAHLKFRDIEGDELTYQRAKTKNTRKTNAKRITVFLLPPALEIIARHGLSRWSPENHVFPILQPDTEPAKEKQLIHQFRKQVNKYTKRVAKSLGIDRYKDTVTARHSFATKLKRSNIPTAQISEALGHADLKTTEIYLDSFDKDTRRKAAAALLNFSANG